MRRSRTPEPSSHERHSTRSNDSNDQYFDFYDYNTYKFRGSLIYMILEKIYAINSFSVSNKAYTDRLTSDEGIHQRDNLYIVSSTFLYDLTDTVSVYLNYSYRDNASNEPVDTYSGNSLSAGIYYTF